MQFLLTPLREGRRNRLFGRGKGASISTHAPAGGATPALRIPRDRPCISTHAPAGGATEATSSMAQPSRYFYSRPCGRGDKTKGAISMNQKPFLLTPLREGRLQPAKSTKSHGIFLLTPLREGRLRYVKHTDVRLLISTHAPAGGATAIFHKSVMRFCGKLPKDDTVLCLASFGFPRRDPKAVYLA